MHQLQNGKKGLPYKEYRYLYPPRPDNKLPPTGIPFYENLGWWAQKKKNGTNTPVFVCGDKVIFKTRHADDSGAGIDHKQWEPLPAHTEFFQSLATHGALLDTIAGKWNAYCAELLHSKTTHIKHQLFIHDVMVMDGVQLVDYTFAERQVLLAKRFLESGFEDEGDQYRINEYVSIAKNYTEGFEDVFKNLGKEDEGLVFKDPNGKLKPCWSEKANAGWSAKVRIPHKNYGF